MEELYRKLIDLIHFTGRVSTKMHNSASIFENIPSGVYIYKMEDVEDDRSLRLIAINPAAERLVGLSASEVVGKCIDENFPGLRKKGIPQTYASIVREGKPLEFEELVYSDSRVRKAHFRVVAFPMPENCLGVAFEDVTDVRKAQAEVRSQARFALECPSPVMRIDNHGYVVYANESSQVVLDHWGISVGEMVPDDSMHLFADAVKTGVRSTVETQVGESILLFDVVPVSQETYVNLYGCDITSRKKAEDEKRELLERHQQAQKMEAIGLLAGGVAHDLNNMFGAIYGYADMIKLTNEDENDEPKDALLDKRIATITSATTRAANLVNQLLAFSRQGKYRSEPIDVHGVIREVTAFLTHSVDKRITISNQLAADGAVVEGDSTQLNNALLNLAVNARDAMPHGGEMRFETKNVKMTRDALLEIDVDTSAGKFVCISVSDTGIGMDEQTQKRAFEPFYTTKAIGEGTGLGLSSAYGTIRNHGGWIEVESEQDVGTTFRVYVPLLHGREET